MVPSILTKQPVKGIYVVYFITAFFVKLPLVSVYRLFVKQHPKWTYRETMGYYFMEQLWKLVTNIEMRPSMSLEPGSDGDSFITIPVPPKALFKGILDDKIVKPVPTGAMWYPRPFNPATDSEKKVVIYFHGGAYVLGGVRPIEGDMPVRLAKQFDDGFALCVQYRLAWGKDCRFPAAVQDALTSYAFLLDQGIPASNIVFAGDSAGGNLAIVLFRYLVEHPDTLPLPASVWMFSPWLDLRWKTIPLMLNHPNYAYDWIPKGLGSWGLRTYLPAGMPDNHPYITLLGNEFKSPIPLFLCTGDAEILYESHMKFVEGMRKAGSRIEVFDIQGGIHCAVALATLSGKSIQTNAAIAKAVQVATTR